jgi:16S rRNA (adenine1518-N6/adenine1519-N6)-dimethyltransferase
VAAVEPVGQVQPGDAADPGEPGQIQLGAAQLLGPTEIRHLAARLGIEPSRRLGQNFVVDAGTVSRITALAGLEPDDVVLEVGPGFGSLTLPLLAAARRVIAIELDRALAAQLPITVAERAPQLVGRLDVVVADAARVGALPGEPPTVLVANLPYNVSVPVVLHLLATVGSLRRGMVMVQAEVADRMCAPPGSRTYGVPSAKLAWFATARRAGSVGRAVFWPVPRVDSGLVELVRHDPPGVAGGAAGGSAEGAGGAGGPGGAEAARAAVFAVIDAAFSQRRKTLRSALAGWAGSAAAAEAVLRAADVDPALRGEALGIADFARIAAAARRPVFHDHEEFSSHRPTKSPGS